MQKNTDLILDINKKVSEEIVETPIVQQTSYWSALKQQQGYQTFAFDFSVDAASISADRTGVIEGDLLMILQPIGDDYHIAYVPYGPELEPDEDYQGLFLESLSEALRELLPLSCILIRYDLVWESPWARQSDRYDSQNQWMGPPERQHQEIRLNINTKNWNIHKSWSDILPSHTIFIDLNKNEDSLLGNMKPKTRYNVRLSQRKGVTVRTVGPEELEVWYQLYQETAQRNGIFVDDLSYFKSVLTTDVSETASPAAIHLLLAEVEGRPLAAMFLAQSNERATYLYGASSSQSRNYMAPYALQWNAMKLARKLGCTEYDMFGVSPRNEPQHPLYGLYRFKSGFGGEMHHRLGCWDYPLNQDIYNAIVAVEMNGQGYHLNK